MTTLICCIPVDAPLWRKAPEADLLNIVSLLSKASYHYADDSSTEWGRARELVKQAAKEVNRLGLCTDAIHALYRHASQLVGESVFFDAVLTDARESS